MRAVIICNGTIKSEHPFYKNFFSNSDLILCADGGSKYIEDLNIEPDAIIGDMDSTPKKMVEKYNIVRIDEQNSTDSEKAIKYAIKKGIKEIILLGATGDRIDHSINNLFLLEKYAKDNIKVVDEINTIWLAKKEEVVRTKTNDIISLIPLEKVTGLEIDGLKYDATELNRSFVGVHNEATKETISIKHKSGTLLINKINQNQ